MVGNADRACSYGLEWGKVETMVKQSSGDRVAQIRAWRRMVSEVTNDVTKNRSGRQSDHEIAIAALVRHADYASYKAAWERYETSGLRGLGKSVKRIKPIGRLWDKLFPTTQASAKMVIADNPAPAVLVYMNQRISKLADWWGVKP